MMVIKLMWNIIAAEKYIQARHKLLHDGCTGEAQ